MAGAHGSACFPAPGGPGAGGGELRLAMGEFEAILAVEPLTVESLFYRLLLAETRGLRGRVAERRDRPSDDRG